MSNLPSFLVDVALRSSLVLATAFLLLFVMQRASASERHLVMLFGLIVVAFIPIGLLLSPKISWTISLPSSMATRETAQNVTAHFTKESPSPLPSTSVSTSKIKPAMLDAFTFSNSVAALLVGGMLSQVILLGRAARSWQRILRQATKTDLPDAALEQARAFTGAREIPSVFASDLIAVPLLAGWLRPTIILPAEARQWKSNRLLMVLCHELAHFKRGDSLLLPLICILRVLYWWHPLVWLALARLRHERENACDDLVLNQNFRASDYADLIVRTARQVRVHRWQMGALAMATPSHLGERIRAILDPALNRRPASRATVLVGTVTTLLLGWFFVAAQVQAEDSLAAPAPDSTAASKPEISLHLILIEINEKTYQQQTASIDEALKSGDISTLQHMEGIRILSRPDLYVKDGIKAEVFMGKNFVQGNTSIPIHILTAQATADANGKITRTVVPSEEMGPSNTQLGVDFKVTPSSSSDGTIFLPFQYGVGEIVSYKDKDNYAVDTSITRDELHAVEGKAYGIWLGDEHALIGKQHAYSLSDIFQSPENPIKTLPPLSPSPNRLALIVTARRVDDKTSASVSNPPPKISGPKHTVSFDFTMVEINEKAYAQQAQAMDEAVRNGDVHFFENRKDEAWFLRTAKVCLLVGQPGWYSEGEVRSYIDSASMKKQGGKLPAALQATPLFYGLNAAFTWSKDHLSLDSLWQVTVPVGFVKFIPPHDVPLTNIHITSFTDKDWDMAQGKEHGFWVGETSGWVKFWVQRKISFDDMIKSKSPTRLAVFMSAQPVTN